jgi:uncharacterized membrane protein
MLSATLSDTAKKNVETIAYVEQQLLGRRNLADRIGDSIAMFFGRLRFIAAHAVFFAVWFIVNLGLVPAIAPFDPYPFSFLGLIVCIEFIFLTTFVLMNQSLQAGREEQWAHLNLQVAMLAEHEVTKNMQMLHMICKHLSAMDREVSELAQPTAVTPLAEAIAQKLGATIRTRRPIRKSRFAGYWELLRGPARVDRTTTLTLD